MSDTVLDRYQAFRTRRYLQNEARYAHYLPGWRTRSRRRLLVWILVASLVALAASSIFILVGPEWAPLTWLPGAILMSVSWTTLQIVTGRRSDAPADALDESGDEEERGLDQDVVHDVEDRAGGVEQAAHEEEHQRGHAGRAEERHLGQIDNQALRRLPQGPQQCLVPSAPGECQQFDVAPGQEDADVSRREWLGRYIDMYRAGMLRGGLLGQLPQQQLGEPLPGTAPPPGTNIPPGLGQFLPEPAAPSGG